MNALGLEFKLKFDSPSKNGVLSSSDNRTILNVCFVMNRKSTSKDQVLLPLYHGSQEAIASPILSPCVRLVDASNFHVEVDKNESEVC